MPLLPELDAVWCRCGALPAWGELTSDESALGPEPLAATQTEWVQVAVREVSLLERMGQGELKSSRELTSGVMWWGEGMREEQRARADLVDLSPPPPCRITPACPLQDGETMTDHAAMHNELENKSSFLKRGQSDPRRDRRGPFQLELTSSVLSSQA